MPFTMAQTLGHGGLLGLPICTRGNLAVPKIYKWLDQVLKVREVLWPTQTQDGRIWLGGHVNDSPTAGAAQLVPPVPRRVPAPLRATLRSAAHAASAPCATVPSRWRFSAPCWRPRASGTALRPLPAPCKAGRSGIAHRNGARHSQRPAQSATARRRAFGQEDDGIANDETRDPRRNPTRRFGT